MAHYPKLLTLSYKSKEINVKLRIRIKLIKYSKFTCKNKECNLYNSGGTITDIIAYYFRKKAGCQVEINDSHGQVPKGMFGGSNKEVKCAECSKIMRLDKTDLMKTTTPKYVGYLYITFQMIIQVTFEG